MNARALQAAIKEDLEALFSETRLNAPPEIPVNRPAYQLDNPEQEPPEEFSRIAPISIFEQELPIQNADGTNPFPYIIVRLDTGGVDSPTAPPQGERHSPGGRL